MPLASGPATEIRPSARALGASSSSDATPPKMNSEICETLTPLRLATSACDSSCTSTEPKKSVATSTATIQRGARARRPPTSSPPTLASVATTSAKITNQLGWTMTRTPATVKSLMPPRPIIPVAPRVAAGR